MNEYTSGGPNPWNMYTSTDPSNPSSQTRTVGVITPDLGRLPESTVGGGITSSPPSPVNAISFGFVATAILIAMFLAMALFEHLLRQRIPSLSASSPQGSAEEAAHSLESEQEQPRNGIHIFGKMRSPQNDIQAMPCSRKINYSAWSEGISWHFTQLIIGTLQSVAGVEFVPKNRCLSVDARE